MKNLYYKLHKIVCSSWDKVNVGFKLNKRILDILVVSIILMFIASLLGVVCFIGQSNQKVIRVACVGDSLTQLSEYCYDLMVVLGDGYDVRNFGVSSTTVTLTSGFSYMDTTAFQDALDFEPDIVVIMLGTNDAHVGFFPSSSNFVDDYLTLVRAFQEFSSNPKIWLVLPPPIFSDQLGLISPKYFEQTILPSITQVANEANLSVIDVYSLLIDYPEYFPDGLHPTMTVDNLGDEPAAQIIAAAIYAAITSPME